MPRNPRTLLVLVGTLPIEDGQTPPPVVGEVGHYPLLFRETDPEAGPDATTTTVQARAEPIGDGLPSLGGMSWDGTVHDEPPHWPTRLHGNGWTASWSAPRPVVGEVRLHGTLVGDFAFMTGSRVRGRVTRARVVTETFTGPDRRRVPALQELREVETSPTRFDHGLVLVPDVRRPGRRRLAPGDPRVVETGVLLDLDLDNVPPLPLRPALVPGSVSASGRDVWVADTRLPRLIRIRDGSTVTLVEWPGRILGTDEVGSRRLHADGGGCWITGADGVHRCDATDPDDTGTVAAAVAVRRVADGAVWHAAAAEGTVAVQVDLDPGDPHARQALRIVPPSGPVLAVEMPDRTASSLAPDGDGFVLLVSQRWHAGITDHDPRSRIARLSRSGSYTEGPPLDGLDHHIATVHASGVIATDKRLYRIRPDLTPDEGRPVSGDVLGVSPAGHVWVRGRGLDQRLSELEPAGLQTFASVPVPAFPAQLAADGEGTVWMLAGGVLRWRPTDGAGPTPVDVGLLAEASRPDPGHSVGPLG